jgi:phosphate transport system substrate-binding protein
VANNKGAIGYLGMGYLSDRTKPMLLSRGSNRESRASTVPSMRNTSDEIQDTSNEAYPPTAENVINKTYPLSRPLYLYTDGEPQGIVKLCIDFALGPVGQAQFKETGFVPVGATLAREP